jgi:hypothetical protein
MKKALRKRSNNYGRRVMMDERSTYIPEITGRLREPFEKVTIG